MTSDPKKLPTVKKKRNLMAPAPGLTAQQLNAISLMFQGYPMKQVAVMSQTDQHTLSKWIKMPAFQQELQLHREAILEFSTDRLKALHGLALDFWADKLREESGASMEERFKAAAQLHAAYNDIMEHTRLQELNRIEPINVDRIPFSMMEVLVQQVRQKKGMLPGKLERDVLPQAKIPELAVIEEEVEEEADAQEK